MITLKTLPQATAQEVFDQITANYANAHFADVNATNAGEVKVDVNGTVKGVGISAHGTPSQVKGAWDRLTGK